MRAHPVLTNRAAAFKMAAWVIFIVAIVFGPGTAAGRIRQLSLADSMDSLIETLDLARSFGRLRRSADPPVDPFEAIKYPLDPGTFVRSPSFADNREDRKRLVINYAAVLPGLAQISGEEVLQYHHVLVSAGIPGVKSKLLLVLTEYRLRCFASLPYDKNEYFMISDVQYNSKATQMDVTTWTSEGTREVVTLCAVARENILSREKELVLYSVQTLGLREVSVLQTQVPFQSFHFLRNPAEYTLPILCVVGQDPATISLEWPLEFLTLTDDSSKPVFRHLQRMEVNSPGNIVSVSHRGSILVVICSKDCHCDVGLKSQSSSQIVLVNQRLSFSSCNRATSPIVAVALFKHKYTPILAVSFSHETVFFGYQSGNFHKSHTVSVRANEHAVTGFKALSFKGCGDGVVYLRSVKFDRNFNESNVFLEFLRLSSKNGGVTSEFLDVPFRCNEGSSICVNKFPSLDLNAASAFDDGRSVEVAIPHGDGDRFRSTCMISIEGYFNDVADPILTRVLREADKLEKLSNKVEDALKLAVGVETGLKSCVRNAYEIGGDPQFLQFDDVSAENVIVDGDVSVLGSFSSPNFTTPTTYSPKEMFAKMNATVAAANVVLDAAEVKLGELNRSLTLALQDQQRDQKLIYAKVHKLNVDGATPILNNLLPAGSLPEILGSKTFLGDLKLINANVRAVNGRPVNFALRSNLNFVRPVSFPRGVTLDSVEIDPHPTLRQPALTVDCPGPYGSAIPVTVVIPLGSIVKLNENVVFASETNFEKHVTIDNLDLRSSTTVDNVPLLDFIRSVIPVNGTEGKVITGAKILEGDMQLENTRLDVSPGVRLNGFDLLGKLNSRHRLNADIVLRRIDVYGNVNITGTLNTSKLNYKDYVGSSPRLPINASTLKSIGGTVSAEYVTVRSNLCYRKFPADFLPIASSQPVYLDNKYFSQGLILNDTEVERVNRYSLNAKIDSLTRPATVGPTIISGLSVLEGVSLKVRNTATLENILNGRNIPELRATLVGNAPNLNVTFDGGDGHEIVVKQIVAENITVLAYGGSLNLSDLFVLKDDTYQVISSETTFANRNTSIDELDVRFINGFDFYSMASIGVRCNAAYQTVKNKLHFLGEVVTKSLELPHGLTGLHNIWEPADPSGRFYAPVKTNRIFFNIGNVRVFTPEEQAIRKCFDETVKLDSDALQIVGDLRLNHLSVHGQLLVEFLNNVRFSRLQTQILRTDVEHQNITTPKEFQKIRGMHLQTDKGICDSKVSHLFDPEDVIYLTKDHVFHTTVNFTQGMVVKDFRNAGFVQGVPLGEMNSSALCFKSEAKCEFASSAVKTFLYDLNVTSWDYPAYIREIGERLADSLLTGDEGRNYTMTGDWTIPSPAGQVNFNGPSMDIDQRIIGEPSRNFTLDELWTMAGVHKSGYRSQLVISGEPTVYLPYLTSVGNINCSAIDGKQLEPIMNECIDVRQANDLKMVLTASSDVTARGGVTITNFRGEDFVGMVAGVVKKNVPDATVVRGTQTMTGLNVTNLLVEDSVEIQDGMYGSPGSSLNCIRTDKPMNGNSAHTLIFQSSVDAENVQIGILNDEIHPNEDLVRTRDPRPPYPLVLNSLKMVEVHVTGPVTVDKLNRVDEFVARMANLVQVNSSIPQHIESIRIASYYPLRSGNLTVGKICSDPSSCSDCRNASELISIDPRDYAQGIVTILPGEFRVGNLVATTLTCGGYINGVHADLPVSGLVSSNSPATLNQVAVWGTLTMKSCGAECDKRILLGNESLYDMNAKVQEIAKSLESKAGRLNRQLNQVCHKLDLLKKGRGGELEVVDTLHEEFTCTGSPTPITSVVVFESEGMPAALVCSSGVPAKLSRVQEEKCQYCLFFEGDLAEGDRRAEDGKVADVTGVVRLADFTEFNGELLFAVVTEPSTQPTNCPADPLLSIWLFRCCCYPGDFKMAASVKLSGNSSEVVLRIFDGKLLVFVAVGGVIVAYNVQLDALRCEATLEKVGQDIPSDGDFDVDAILVGTGKVMNPTLFTFQNDSNGKALVAYTIDGQPVTLHPSKLYFQAVSYSLSLARTPYGSFLAIGSRESEHYIRSDKSEVQFFRLSEYPDGLGVHKYQDLEMAGNIAGIASLDFSHETSYVPVVLEKESLAIIRSLGASGFSHELQVHMDGIAKMSNRLRIGAAFYTAVWTADCGKMHLYGTRKLGESRFSGDVCPEPPSADAYPRYRLSFSPYPDDDVVASTLPTAQTALLKRRADPPGYQSWFGVPMEMNKGIKQLIMNWVFLNANVEETEKILQVFSRLGAEIQSKVKADIDIQNSSLDTLRKVADFLQRLKSDGYRIGTIFGQPSGRDISVGVAKDDAKRLKFVEALANLGIDASSAFKFIIAGAGDSNVFYLDVYW